MNIILKGKIDSVGKGETKNKKQYQTINFKQQFENGAFSCLSVKDYSNFPGVKSGDEVEIGVFINPYISKKGGAALDYVAIKDSIKVNGTASAKRPDVRV